MKTQNIYTVAQVNSYIKNMFTQDFVLQLLSVRGEVSNCKYHSSGHIYFTLKDGKGSIACVMFSTNRRNLGFQLRDGQQVVVEGTVDVYERDGKYQLYAREIRPDGAGALYERFEQLKQELEERGMFAEQYKQPIPHYISTLGVVTAPTGAAVRDIINIAHRRNPYLQIVLYPAVVQGEEAPGSIVNGIRALERYGVDTIIVGRGGGSIEDLWAFNEEIVAQAIFDCAIPVISAVGHETDTTIADYVADLRAPTPSAAAELAVYDMRQLEERLDEYCNSMQRLMGHTLNRYRARCESYALRLKYESPAGHIRTKRTALLTMEEHLQNLMQRVLMQKRHEMELLIEQMKGLSPLDKLNQGYSYVADRQHRTLSSIEGVKPGDDVEIYVRDGRMEAKVSRISPWEFGV